MQPSITNRGPHQPVRTCVGCRKPDHKTRLLRVVVATGAVVLDPAQRMSGRGAYLHPSDECARRAIPRGIARSLRTGVSRTSAEALRAAAAHATKRHQVACQSVREKGQS